ncbi:MAG: beta strand repeat-containing protein [Planctomycetaceae bacterium]
MRMSSWLRSVPAQIRRRLSSLSGVSTRRAVGRNQRSNQCLETLEPRLLPATLLSINTDGTNSGNDASGDTNFFTLPIISDDGRFVAFYSRATDISLEGGVGNPTQRSIHVRDRQTNTTDLIQSTGEDPQATADVTMSADGRFVAFLATTRLANTRGAGGIYLTDRINNTTTLISNNNSGGANEGESRAPLLSADGRFVPFVSRESLDEPTNDNVDFLGNTVRDQSFNLYVHDTQTGLSRLVNATPSGAGGNNGTLVARYAFSLDGTKLLFNSASSDLVANDTNGVVDVFLRDLTTNTTTLISVNAAGTDSANVGGSLLGLSADGSRVLFLSTSNNLVAGRPADGLGDIFLRDLNTNTTTLVSSNTAGTDSEGIGGTITPNGRFVYFESTESLVPGAPAGGSVYRKDLQTDELLLVTVRPDGTPSPSGGRIATGGVTAVPLGQTISADGRFVVFISTADDLVPGFVDGNQGSAASEVFVRDVLGGVTTLISDSITSPTTSSNGQAFFAAISADGKVVTFQSVASDLTATDTNEVLDVFANTVPTPGQPGQLQFDAATAEVNEDDGTVTLNVTRTGGSYGIVRVNVGITNGTAASGSDFTAPSNTLTFLNGETSKTISISILDETTFEANETFAVTLSNPTANAILGTATSATVTIANDDAAPTVTLGISAATLAEAAGTATVTATLSASAGVATIVELGFSGAAQNVFDYTRSNSQIVIAAGSMSGTITLTAVNDTLGEVNEPIIVGITEVTNGTESETQEVTTEIVSDDTEVSVEVSAPSVSEDGAANLIYTFTRAGITTGATTVQIGVGGTATLSSDFAQSGATSFSATAATLAFAAGQTTRMITINPVSNLSIEANETVILTVNPSATYSVGAANSATGTIANDDFPTVRLAVSPAAVLENGTGNSVYTFTRTGPTISELTVNFTVGGTATLDNDYAISGATAVVESTSSVTFGIGQATKTVTLDPTGDMSVEPNETVLLGLAAGSGYTIGTLNPVTATITNDDAEVTVSVSPSSVTEDGTPNLVYTFTRAGATANALAVSFAVSGSATLTTDYAQSGAATFTAAAGTVSFAAGQSTKTITINPVTDAIIEPDETVILTLASAATYTIGTANAAIGTIANDDPRVSLAVTPASLLENGTGNATYTFTRTGSTANPVTVNFTVGGTATFNSDYLAIGAASFTETSGSVTFNAGQATKTVLIDPTGDSMLESNETVILTISAGDEYVIGTPMAATATINNDDAEISVAVSPAGVTEDGVPNLFYTFTRIGATAGALTANFTVSGTASRTNDYAPSGSASFTATTGTVLFSAGQSTKIVIINPTADVIVEPDETLTLTLTPAETYLIGTANSATGIILNDDPRVTVAASPGSVTENGTANATYTFRRTGPTTNPLTLNFDVGGTATLSTDYTTSGAVSFTESRGSVTFAAGQASKIVLIDPIGDTAVEANETVVLTLVTGADYVVGTPLAATATITSDDAEVTVAVSPSSVDENGTPNLIYTFTRVGLTTSALTVSFTVGGTATFSSDYSQSGAAAFNATVGSVSFAAGQFTKFVTINPTGNTTAEPDETVILTVTPAANYSVGTANSAIGTILNDDVSLSLLSLIEELP